MVSMAERKEWLGSAGENLPPLGYPQQTRQYPAAFWS